MIFALSKIELMPTWKTNIIKHTGALKYQTAKYIFRLSFKTAIQKREMGLYKFTAVSLVEIEDDFFHILRISKSLQLK